MAESEEKVDKIPDVLYKYYSFETERQFHNIEKNQFYFASRLEFNDPFDGGLPYKVDADFVERKKKHFFDSFKQELKRVGINKKELLGVDEKELFEWLDKNIRELEQERDEIGVCCFSELYENTLLWSHYANKHRGFCVGYSGAGLCYLNENDKLSFLTKMIYRKKPKINLLFSDPDYIITKKQIINSLNTKEPLWKYEQEWRFSKLNFAGNKLDFDEALVQNILLGCRCSKFDELLIRSIFRNRTFKPKLFRMKQSETDFSLIPEELEW